MTLQTSVAFYNLFNFANFDLPAALLNGLLTGAAGQINATNALADNIDWSAWEQACTPSGLPGRLSSG